MNIKNPLMQKFLPWLDVITFTAWGALFLRYWSSDLLALLIHPNFFPLVLGTGLILLMLASFKTLTMIRSKLIPSNPGSTSHITLFPPSLSLALMLGVAIIGFLIPPGVLTSQTAMQRGVSETLPVTRSQPASFRATVKPENRTLIEWVRTLNAYPEPDAYVGQKANVTGFVVHSPNLPDNYLLLTRFVISCCAVDAYPVALPVKLEQDKDTYPPDTWLEVQGQMITETLEFEGTTQGSSTEQRKLVISAQAIEIVPTPRDPYEY